MCGSTRRLHASLTSQVNSLVFLQGILSLPEQYLPYLVHLLLQSQNWHWLLCWENVDLISTSSIHEDGEIATPPPKFTTFATEIRVCHKELLFSIFEAVIRQNVILLLPQ